MDAAVVGTARNDEGLEPELAPPRGTQAAEAEVSTVAKARIWLTVNMFKTLE